MKIVKKEDLAKLLLDYDVPFDERKSIVTEEFNIPLEDTIEDGEQFLDYVYDIYMKTVEEYELTTKALYRKEKIGKKRTGTIKEFIINIIEKRKVLKVEELHKIVDEEFHYSDNGKNPRTRCRKVIQQLVVEDKIKVTGEEKLITWKD